MNTQTQKTALERFNEVINQATKCIPFNADWNNGTGYLDRATEDASLNLGKGEMARSLTVDEHDVELNNRRVLFIGVGNGTNVVVFERYNGGNLGIIVSNTPYNLAGFEGRTNSHTSFYPDTLDLVIDEVSKL